MSDFNSDDAVSSDVTSSETTTSSTPLNSSAQDAITQWIKQMESATLPERIPLASNIKKLAGESWPSEVKRICDTLNCTTAEVEAYVTLTPLLFSQNKELLSKDNLLCIAERISIAESLKPKKMPLESLLEELDINNLFLQDDAWERALLSWVIKMNSTEKKQDLLDACNGRESSRRVTTKFVKTVKSRLAKKNITEEDINKLVSFIEKASARRPPTQEAVLVRAEKAMEKLLSSDYPIPEKIKDLAMEICEKASCCR